MAMDAGEIERLIKEGIPDAQVTIRDLAGDGNHYAATVLAPGAERDPAESVRAFLGRDPTIDALLARDGIERHHRGWDPASASHDRAGGRLNE